MQCFSNKRRKNEVKLEVTKEDLEEFQKEEKCQGLEKECCQSYYDQAMHEVYEGYSVVDPDFDDENCLTSTAIA